jgi:DNA repair protein RadD
LFELNILINHSILATGIDLPRVDELYLLRKFGNETTAMQVLGRALRGEKNGGNLNNKVISIKGNKSKIADESELYNLIKNMY